MRQTGAVVQKLCSAYKTNSYFAGALVALAALFVSVAPSENAAAACSAPVTSYGVVNSTISVPASGKYLISSRIKAPDTVNNSYLLEIDGGSCFNVGGSSSIPANAWTWVDYQVGGAKVEATLSAGTHTVKLIGSKPGVAVDVLALSADTTKPTASVTEPLAGTTVKGLVDVKATANDDTGGSGVGKVELYVDGVLRGTDATGPNPYAFSLDTSSLTNGSHTLAVKAYDNAGNVGALSTAVSVTVANGDTTDPVVSLKGLANGQVVSNGSATVEAVASDNVGVTKVDFYLDGILNKTEVNPPYCMVESSGSCAPWSTATLPNGAHSITAKAYDAVGNSSSSIVSYTVQNGDTEKPSVPGNVVASAVSATQTKVTWSASTDNVGVTGYCIARNDGKTVCPATTSMSYTDSSVLPSTTYGYTVTARDAAGNYSAASSTASVTTPATPDVTPPSAPGGVAAVAVSSSQVNVSWSGSTDNVKVAAYDVFRDGTKVGTTSSTSFGDTGLNAKTTYVYTVAARDAAGNMSQQSLAATVVTQDVPAIPTGTLTGTVSVSGGKLQGAHVVMNISGKTMLYSVASNGKYTIPGLVAGTYVVQYSAKNMATQSKTVAIGSGSTTTQNVTLVRR